MWIKLQLEFFPLGIGNTTLTLTPKTAFGVWGSSMYLVDVLQVSKQLVHYKVLQIHTSKTFFITFIYGFNQEQ